MPARHRDALAPERGQITLTQHPDGCWMLFPRSAWEAFRARIAELPMQAPMPDIFKDFSF